MTIEECYEKLHGNYAEAMARLGMEKLVDRFMHMFLKDGSMALLREAVVAGDIEASFAAIHTLKGVVANLSFTELMEAASALTEQLRPKTEPADPALMQKVEEGYQRVIEAINEYDAAQA